MKGKEIQKTHCAHDPQSSLARRQVAAVTQAADGRRSRFPLCEFTRWRKLICSLRCFRGHLWTWAELDMCRAAQRSGSQPGGQGAMLCLLVSGLTQRRAGGGERGDRAGRRAEVNAV